jgi:alkylation response protein AidB-like acyl-CoA dehydrogenase
MADAEARIRTGQTWADFCRALERAGEVITADTAPDTALDPSQLNAERVSLSSAGVVQRRLDEVPAWAQQAKLSDGRRVIDQEWVQLSLGRVRAKLEYLTLLNHKLAWSATRDAVSPADASAVKVFGSEFYIEAYRLLLEVLGQDGMLESASPGAPLRDSIERMMRQRADPDLRRRHQRGAAGHHRHPRPGDAAQPLTRDPPLHEPTTRQRTWTSSSATRPRPSPSWRRAF